MTAPATVKAYTVFLRNEFIGVHGLKGMAEHWRKLDPPAQAFLNYFPIEATKTALEDLVDGDVSNEEWQQLVDGTLDRFVTPL